ncbi:cell wall surface anchor family protein [Rubellimicrobium mesophilum DSM 19309]|uniref:Cell wall surface anchor family protein n=1 Tax=Rubellimicrobium mesophilum DSM 19309 TaxID=442562 RepID=A0A017HI25_9RHOB|nr:hypothetical protein [Rubellimicrobium mesophilum]EYD74132.1 cell wall surface anchor family protein [Rubellimicrobium mesophilum DSM 19309]
MIDDLLTTGRRGLRTRPGTLLLGSTGARLWADYLEERPGFVGAIDFIHKLNIPSLFEVFAGASGPPAPADVIWRPSHLSVSQRFGALALAETKFIDWNDCAVSVQEWRNEGTETLLLRVTVDPSWIVRAGDVATGERAFPERDFTVRAVVSTSRPELWDGLPVAPGETVSFVVAAALGLAESDSRDDLESRLRPLLDPVEPREIVAAQAKAYDAWFHGVPRFTSSSLLLDRTFAYRWFLLRHNLARPGLGALPGPVIYEGRSHKMGKAPFAPSGWEFSKLIPLSTPMHLLELRWHATADLGGDLLAALAAAQGIDGQLYAKTVNETMHPYANFAGWAAWQYALARGLDPRLAAGLPTLKRQVIGERENLATAGDALPLQVDHRLTGKEYQPSYWYFHGFPDDPFDKATYTPLKRVDRAVYQHLNARGVAALAAALGDEDAPRFAALAEEVATDILSKQWDSKTGFFYDLDPETDRKAMVRNIVGFYPAWAGLTDAEQARGLLAALVDGFDTGCPFPSVARDCPVYQPGGSWKGQFLKGRNGCMWDGPTWPYTNSITLDALARLSREAGHAHDELFAKRFWDFVLLHFQGRDGVTPYLVEHYDSATGEPISDEPDYNHSYFIDLVLRHVVGLEVGAGTRLTVDPIDIGLDSYSIEGLNIRGMSLSVRFSRAEGLRLLVEGNEVARRDKLEPLQWEGLPILQ